MTIIYLTKCMESSDFYKKKGICFRWISAVSSVTEPCDRLYKRQDSCTQLYQDVSHPLEDSTHCLSTHHLLCVDGLPLHAVCDTRVSWWPNVRGTYFTIIPNKYKDFYNVKWHFSYRGLCMFKQYFLNWCGLLWLLCFLPVTINQLF